MIAFSDLFKVLKSSVVQIITCTASATAQTEKIEEFYFGMTVKTTHGGESTHTMASQSDEAMAESSSSASAASATDSSVPPAAANRGISGNAQPLTPEQKESVRQVMLERLSTTGAHFAHQQRDSPDLTQQEKISIAAEILHKNPATFLAR